MDVTFRLFMIFWFLTAANPCISLAFAFRAPREPSYVAIYLGPTQLTSAHCPQGEKPVQIAQVEANQGWKDWALKRATDGPLTKRDPLDPWEYDQDLLTMFIPTLQQIAKATTIKLQQPYEIYYIVISSTLTGLFPHSCINTMNALIRNSTDPDSEHFADPPLPFINVDDRVPYMRVGPASLMAYNLTTPEAWGTWGRTTQNDNVRPGYGFYNDDDFALLINFEPKYLELTFECPDWACQSCVRSLFLDLGEKSLFHGAPDWNVASEEWDITLHKLSDGISGFVRANTHSPEYGTLRIVTLFGGASPQAVDAIKIALTLAFPKLELWRLKTHINPAFVPSLGAALHARNEVESYRPVVDLYGTAHLAKQVLLGLSPISALEGCCNIFDYYRLKEY